MPVQIVLCEDDLNFAEQCKQRLAALAEKHGVEAAIEIIPNGGQLVYRMDDKTAIDVIYMDYHMPGEDGMQTARTLRDHGIDAELIFFTVDESHAVEGYDVDALQYLIKGKTDDAKFESVFLKSVERCRKKQSEMIALSCAGERRNIDLADILYFEVNRRIITVHYLEGAQEQVFEFYSTLSKLEEVLSDKRFLRVHSAYLVNARFIGKVTRHDLRLKDAAGTVLPVGRSYAGKL